MNQKISNNINIYGFFYAVLALGISILVFSKTTDKLGFDAGFGIALSVLLFGISFAIYFVKRKKSFKIHFSFFDSAFNRNIVSLAVAALLVIAGIYLRGEAISSGRYVLDNYIELSFVDGSASEFFIEGATRLFVNLLHGILFAFGNNYMPALVFQSVCQMAGLVLVYFSLKNIYGEITALLFMAFGCLSPACINSACSLGPSHAYFLIAALCIFILSSCVQYKFSTPVFAGMAGIVAGLLFYLDISGIAVILLSFIILKSEAVTEGIGRKNKKNLSHDKIFSLIVFMAGVILCILVCLITDIVIHGSRISSFVSEIVAVYRPEEFSFYRFYNDSNVISGSILAFLLLLGIPDMLLNKKAYSGIAFLALTAVFLLSGFSMSEDNIDGCLYVAYILFVLAGRSFAMLFGTENTDSAVKVKLSEHNDAESMNTVHKVEEETEMLQNPLPVPTKKKKKKLDYDYYVPDESDYDL